MGSGLGMEYNGGGGGRRVKKVSKSVSQLVLHAGCSYCI